MASTTMTMNTNRKPGRVGPHFAGPARPKAGAGPRLRPLTNLLLTRPDARETDIIWVEVHGEPYQVRFWSSRDWALIPAEMRPANAMEGEGGGYWAFDRHEASPRPDRLIEGEVEAAMHAIFDDAEKARRGEWIKAFGEAEGEWPDHVRARGTARIRELLRGITSPVLKIVD